MPGTSKTKWAQLRVGLLGIAALLILAYLIFLLSGTLGFFKSKTTLYTYMSDSAALATSSDVRLNGILIGKVTGVSLSGSSDPNRAVKVTMQVDDEFVPQIPVDSQTELAAQNLLGTKYININRGRNPRTVQPGAELPSRETAELTDLFQQGSTTLGALQTTIDSVNGIIKNVQSGKGTIGELLVDDTLYKKALAIADAAQSIADDGKQVVAALNSNSNSVGKMLHDNNQLYAQMQGGLDKINTLIDGINKGEGTLGKFVKDPAVYDQSRQILMQVHDLLAGLDAGQGTAGKFLKSDEMSTQIKDTLARVDTLLDKINNGQGTISQLLNNPALYESLDGTTREMHGLLQDFRANPKKFLRIKLGLF